MWARQSGSPVKLQHSLTLDFLFLVALEPSLDLEQPIQTQNNHFILQPFGSTLVPTQHM